MRLPPGSQAVWPMNLRNGMKLRSGMASSQFRVFRRKSPPFPGRSLFQSAGRRLAISVILHGHAGSVDDYNQAMDVALKKVLVKLMVAPRSETESDVPQAGWRLVEQPASGSG
jgi:hypothetical protein